MPAQNDLSPGDTIKRIDGAYFARPAEACWPLCGEVGDAAVEARRGNRSAESAVAKRLRRGISVFGSSHDGDGREEEVEIGIEETH